METQLNYGNWIRKRILWVLGSCTLGAAILFFLPFGLLYQIVVGVLFVILLFSFLFPFYSYWMFSQRGGRIQEKVYNLIIQCLGATVKGRVLDIGSGNGVLAVKVALQHEQVEVVGVDYWGANWEYSKGVCDANARAAQVEERVQFQKGDAATLDFGAGTFDGAISNLTFHEVQSVADKREVLREALRVIKPGGVFAFVDYFYEAKYYGEISHLNGFLESLALTEYQCKPLIDMLKFPWLLKHPKILGKVGIIYGKK